jgi:hypothetical protein
VHPNRGGQPVTGIEGVPMRRAFQVVTVLLLVAVVIQFYFAAFGVFTQPANDSQFVLHQMNGRVVLPALCLLVIAAAALARAPGRLIGFSALPLGLLTVQIVLFLVAGLLGSTEEKTNLAGQIILGLHAINGLAILGVTIVLVRRASRLAAAGRTAVSPEPPAPHQEPARS